MRRRSKHKHKGFESPPGQKRTAGWSRKRVLARVNNPSNAIHPEIRKS